MIEVAGFVLALLLLGGAVSFGWLLLLWIFAWIEYFYEKRRENASEDAEAPEWAKAMSRKGFIQGLLISAATALVSQYVFDDGCYGNSGTVARSQPGSGLHSSEDVDSNQMLSLW